MSEPARRQPKGLYVLFLTEMWERFGYYTMVYLLVLYLTNSIGMDDDSAYLLFGAFTSFVYLTTVGGGYLADRVLGFRRAIVLGTVMMCAGYLLLSLGQGQFLYLGLATLTIGNGFFKPNVSSLLGQLYDRDDERRESGFTIFYMGINCGVLAAGLSMGYVADTIGYHWAFAFAGMGKLIALFTFLYGQRYLQGEGLAPSPDPLWRRAGPGISNAAYLGAGVAAALALSYFLLRHDVLGGDVLALLAAGVVMYFLYEVSREDPGTRRPLIALTVLIGFAVVFWAIYSQTGLSVMLFIERSVDRTVFGETLPPSEFGTLNPLFILILAPLFVWLWTRLARANRNPSITMKFVLGLVLIGASFFMLRLGCLVTEASGLVESGWLVAFFLLYTSGEMCIAPVGMAMVTRLAPARLLGFAMGMWFLALALANYLGGMIAEFANVPKHAGLAVDRSIYEQAFVEYGWFCIASAVVLLALLPMLNRLMAGEAASRAQPKGA